MVLLRRNNHRGLSVGKYGEPVSLEWFGAVARVVIADFHFLTCKQ